MSIDKNIKPLIVPRYISHVTFIVADTEHHNLFVDNVVNFINYNICSYINYTFTEEHRKFVNVRNSSESLQNYNIYYKDEVIAVVETSFDLSAFYIKIIDFEKEKDREAKYIYCNPLLS